MKQLYEMYEDYGKSALIWIFIDMFFYILISVFMFSTIYFIKDLSSMWWEVFFILSYFAINLYCFIMLMCKIEVMLKIIRKPESLERIIKLTKRKE